MKPTLLDSVSLFKPLHRADFENLFNAALNVITFTDNSIIVYAKWKLVIFILVIITMLTNVIVILDIPYIRPILGFVVLTVMPGFLVINLLNLNKLSSLERILLAWIINIPILNLFYFAFNFSMVSFGYSAPLATLPILLMFNILILFLITINYMRSGDKVVSLSVLYPCGYTKTALSILVALPSLGILGMYLLNYAKNDGLIRLLIVLISIIVISLSYWSGHNVSKIYPIVIYAISLSLLTLLALKSNHIIGSDIHREYYLFFNTFEHMHWEKWMDWALNACLTISLLPTVYASILHIPPEFLFKILYSILYSITPLIVYFIALKYLEAKFAFLASCFFMFQHNFLLTEYYTRSNMATLFISGLIMVMFSDKIDILNKKFLTIIIIAGCVFSHYSSTYILFFILSTAYLIGLIVHRFLRYSTFLNINFIVLFFVLIFLWYSQLTGSAFDAGITHILDDVLNLNALFWEDLKIQEMQTISGQDIYSKGNPQKIEFFLTWANFLLIGIGLLYACAISARDKLKIEKIPIFKCNICTNDFEIDFLIISSICISMLLSIYLLPRLVLGYSVDRLFSSLSAPLSVFFIIGGYIVLNLPLIRKYVTFLACNHLLIIIVLIAYFFCVTGITYQALETPRDYWLSTKNEKPGYVYDQESYAALWLSYNANNDRIYADYFGQEILLSQGRIKSMFSTNGAIYIYLRSFNTIENKFATISIASNSFDYENITKYNFSSSKWLKIYDSDNSEVLFCNN